MDDDRRFQLAQWTLERQLGWITAADAKAGFLIGMYLALAAVAVTLLESQQLSDTEKLLLCAATIVSLPSAVFAVLVFFPKTDGPKGSMFYFGGIVETGVEGYASQLRDLSDAAALNDISAQIVRNAEIAKHKHEKVACSVRFAALAVLVWIVALATMAALS